MAGLGTNATYSHVRGHRQTDAFDSNADIVLPRRPPPRRRPVVVLPLRFVRGDEVIEKSEPPSASGNSAESPSL